LALAVFDFTTMAAEFAVLASGSKFVAMFAALFAGLLAGMFAGMLAAIRITGELAVPVEGLPDGTAADVFEVKVGVATLTESGVGFEGAATGEDMGRTAGAVWPESCEALTGCGTAVFLLDVPSAV
jgi:hypothetical protein